MELVGYDSRLDEIQAAFLRVQLPELDAWAPGRAQPRRAASGPDSGSSWRCQPDARCNAAWHIYVIRYRRVATISQALSAAEIGDRADYTRPIHRHPAMAPYVEALELPMTRRARLDAPGHPDESVPHRRAGDRGHALRRAALTQRAA